MINLWAIAPTQYLNVPEFKFIRIYRYNNLPSKRKEY